MVKVAASHGRSSRKATDSTSLAGARIRRRPLLRVGAADDAFEREADRAAEVAAGGGRLAGGSFSLSLIPVMRVQREEGKGSKETEKYKEGLKKVGEAFLDTPLGKKLKARLEADPLVKGAKGFAGTLHGKVIVGSLAAGTVAALAATGSELPMQIPEIPLDALTPGLKVKITYEGPVDKPTKAMISFSYTEQVRKPDKPAATAAEEQRAENARMALELWRFRRSLRYGPGTPEAKEREAEERAWRSVVFGQVGTLPELAGTSLYPGLPPQPKRYELEVPGLWKPKPISLLDKELELTPRTELSGTDEPARKKEDEEGAPLQRYSRGDAGGAVAPGAVGEVASTEGCPMDPGTRAFMERRFGHDFSRVRVHTDARAARSAQAIRAEAYTTGNHVVFGPGRYTPDSPDGRRLLAHELAHVVQQGEGPHSAGSAETHQIQRAEHGTYVSRISETGEPAYLDAGEKFYRTWGHPNVKRVSTMMEVMTDLNRARGTIDRFRIVSHGNRAGIEVGLLPEIAPDWFGKDAAEFTTQKRFREVFVGLRLVGESHFRRIYQALRKDTTTGPLVISLGAGTDVPDAKQPLGILLRAMVDARYLADVKSDKGGKPAIAHRGKLQAFNQLRMRVYEPLVLDGVAKAKRREARRSIAKLRAELPRVLASAKITFASLSESEAANLADPFVEPSKRGARIPPKVKKAIREGARGPYLKTLLAVKKKINDTTHIEVRGCNVGRSSATLDMIRGFFGRPGALPSISAPDLYQYFFQLGVTSYGTRASEGERLEAAFADASTGLAESYERLKRLKAREMTVVVNESSLAELAGKHGFNAARVRKLNPEIADPAKLKPGMVVWLVQRSEVPAGIYRTLGDFCKGYLGNLYAWPKVWASNAWLKKPDALSPGDRLRLPREVLTPPVASPTPTVAEFVRDIRAGKPVAAVDVAQNKPIVHLDDPKRAKALGEWLAAQKFDPRGRTAAVLSRRYAGKTRKFMAARARTYVQFLSRSYPGITDPIFPEDPRYEKHIIRRP